MREIIKEDIKRQILYIKTDAIMPPRGTGYKEAFKEPYEERIRKYASAENREIINKAIAEHPDWKISEFCDAF